MATNGDYVRPLFPGLTLPDSATVSVQRAVPVGPEGGYVRDALAQVFPTLAMADDDWVVVEFDPKVLGDSAAPALVDDPFSGTVVDPARWMVVSGRPSVSSGRLHIPNTYPTSSVRYVNPVRFAGLTATMFGLVAPVGSSNDSVKTRGLYISSLSSGGNQAYFAKTFQSLTTYVNGASPAGLASFPYDPVAHANLRLRESAGKLYWEASSNGSSWVTLRWVVSPAWLATQDARVELSGGAYQSGGSDPSSESSLDRFLLL